MPGYKSHIVGGIVAYGVGLYIMQQVHPSYTVMAEWLVCTIAGSLFPDIDIKSKGQKLFYLLIITILGWLLLRCSYTCFIILSIVAMIPMVVRHRGIFHRLWFIALLSMSAVGITYCCAPQYVSMVFFNIFFFLLGAISHLWLDLGFRRMLQF